METIKVSVVIPAFNAQKYLEQCLLSIKNQTVKPYETFVINDGSTDNTMWLTHRLGFKTLDRLENKGIGFTRKEGADFASGDYVAFLSADDAYHPYFLELMMRETDGEIALFCNTWRCNQNLDPESIFLAPRFKTQEEFRILAIEWALKQNMFVNFSTVMIPKYFFNKVQFKENLRYGEDLMFLLETVLARLPWKNVGLPLVYYRVHPQAGTFQNWNLNQRQILWSHLCPLLQKLNIDEATVQKARKKALQRELKRQPKRLIPTQLKVAVKKLLDIRQ